MVASSTSSDAAMTDTPIFSPILDAKKTLLVMRNTDLNIWLDNLTSIQVPESDIHRVIANYLFVNMHEESFNSFVQETQFQADDLKPTISQRKVIRNAILEGRMVDAIDSINALDPGILKENGKVLFTLLLYHLVDIIKTGNLVNAVSFVKTEISQCIQKDSSLLPSLEEAMSLLAFSNLEAPEAVDVISKIQQSNAIATTVDNALLSYHHLDPQSTLENIVKESLWVESKIETLATTHALKLEDVGRCGFIMKRLLKTL
ncbi:hypothetical protein BEWA_032510 [Theileria equi strain WA]|uniref:CTLH domain-containing protein n=1 Tax=Theileria equi strain WA TaxID=1537102 RepID=L0AYU7_THEEQ|nr:hypothetical protein BEWA_032510 [Theileria equi strain WA]AFZ80398.1 hypothetical protein BEWA_032510 [Theileria equi strain WA]|eukprot:XP_004830064.1 hypothetical protein BEWA_032510 [Theileria equi strain WA]